MRITIVALFILLLSGCNTFQSSGSITAHSKSGPIAVKQPSNSETPALLDFYEENYEIVHVRGDVIRWSAPSGEIFEFIPERGSVTNIYKQTVGANTGHSREDLVGLLGQHVKGVAPLMWAAIATGGLGLLLTIFTPWKREGLLVMLGAVFFLLIRQLALSPWFGIIGGIFVIGAGITFYLEKMGYINASGYGEANEEVTKKRKKFRLAKLKAQEETLKAELED